MTFTFYSSHYITKTGLKERPSLLSGTKWSYFENKWKNVRINNERRKNVRMFWLKVCGRLFEIYLFFMHISEISALYHERKQLKDDFRQRQAEYLAEYRKTVQDTTNQTSAERLQERKATRDKQ